MVTEKKKTHIKSKVWIEDGEGRVIFGPGRMRILEAIKRCGSLNAAARDLGMSYRGLWGKIKTTEEALGKPLLSKSVGGLSGGGSTLTRYAGKIMRHYYRLKQTIRLQADRLFEDDFTI